MIHHLYLLEHVDEHASGRRSLKINVLRICHNADHFVRFFSIPTSKTLVGINSEVLADGIAAREVVSSHGLIDYRDARTPHILHAEIAPRLERSAECFEVAGRYPVERDTGSSFCRLGTLVDDNEAHGPDTLDRCSARDGNRLHAGNAPHPFL